MRNDKNRPVIAVKFDCPDCGEKNCRKGKEVVHNCVRVECEKCGNWGLVLVVWKD